MENSQVEIDYVYERPEEDDLYKQFAHVFEKFSIPTNGYDEDQAIQNKEIQDHDRDTNHDSATSVVRMVDDEESGDYQQMNQKISKKKLKTMSRMSVAELKQKVDRPELVEMHDVTAKDPILLLHLKSTRNSVPVPKHWCYKRKYLQGKRGYEKPPFVLPDFIRRTGIMEMRQAVQEKDDQKTLKSKMREKIRPKMGKLDIDYQKFHDAFFKWQVKPRLTIHGDLYYEGKEFETRLKEKKPGELSSELRTALGMPTGPNASKVPPTWLIAMQRYGPPPSYPNLKIPGLNCPIPEGCSFGYHVGGWGKPPVDEFGRPLYGDVFGLNQEDGNNIKEEAIDTTLWGELQSDEEDEDGDKDLDDEEETAPDEKFEMLKPLDKKKDDLTGGLITPMGGIATPSGLVSVPTGIETPDLIELRKRTIRIEQEMEMNELPALYKLLPEKKVEELGKDLMPSSYTYDTSAIVEQEAPKGDADFQKDETTVAKKLNVHLENEKVKRIKDFKF